MATGSQSVEAFFAAAGTVFAVLESSSVADDLEVWALSSADGHLLWSKPLGTGAQVLGLSGNSLVTLDADGITAISATGSVLWTDGLQSGCDDLAAAADDDLVEVAQRCSGLLKLIAIDPATGGPVWATVLSSAFPTQHVYVTAALHGGDGVVTIERGGATVQPVTETLISRSGSLLGRFLLDPDAVQDLWGLDGPGNLVRVEQDQADVSLQELDPVTGARLRQSSIPDPLSQTPAPQVLGALQGGSFGMDTYVVASLPDPLLPAGLAVFDPAASRSTLFLLPVAGSSVAGVATGPRDVYVTETTMGTDSLVAYSRAGLDGTGTPSTLAAKKWPQACGILPAQRLSSLTGHSYAGYGQAVRADGFPPGSTCLYTTTAPGQSGLEIDVAWDGTSDAATAGLTAQAASFENFHMTPVAIGDQAYKLVHDDPYTPELTCEVVLRVGTVLVIVKSSASTTLAAQVAPAIAANLAALGGR